MSELVDQLAYRLDITVEQKQSFLEQQDVQKRVQFIHSTIQMKIDLVKMAKSQLKKGFDVRLNWRSKTTGPKNFPCQQTEKKTITQNRDQPQAIFHGIE